MSTFVHRGQYCHPHLPTIFPTLLLRLGNEATAAQRWQHLVGRVRDLPRGLSWEKITQRGDDCGVIRRQTPKIIGQRRTWTTRLDGIQRLLEMD
jgi:hypothetical protein